MRVAPFARPRLTHPERGGDSRASSLLSLLARSLYCNFARSPHFPTLCIFTFCSSYFYFLKYTHHSSCPSLRTNTYLPPTHPPTFFFWRSCSPSDTSFNGSVSHFAYAQWETLPHCCFAHLFRCICRFSMFFGYFQRFSTVLNVFQGFSPRIQCFSTIFEVFWCFQMFFDGFGLFFDVFRRLSMFLDVSRHISMVLE